MKKLLLVPLILILFCGCFVATPENDEYEEEVMSSLIGQSYVFKELEFEIDEFAEIDDEELEEITCELELEYFNAYSGVVFTFFDDGVEISYDNDYSRVEIAIYDFEDDVLTIYTSTTSLEFEYSENCIKMIECGDEINVILTFVLV